MGIEVGRIEKEYILGSVQDKQIPVQVHAMQNRYEAFIKSFDTDQLELLSEDAEVFSPDQEVSVFFSYYGHTMTFESTVTELGDGSIIVGYPKAMVKNLERKYERVLPPKSITASFIAKGKKIVLDFPRSEEYFNPIHKPAALDDIESTSLQGMINDFRAQVAKIVVSNKIKMFRDSKPETFEERCISKFGRCLYIPQTEAYKFQLDRIGDIQLLDHEKMRQHLLEEGTSEKNIELKMDSIVSEKRDDNIFSELYCPILFQEYVVGYIYLANTNDKKRSISEDLIEYVDQFAKILSYSLKSHGYFKGSKPVPMEYSAEILDISASGLLFIHSSPELAENFVLYTDFDLLLQFDKRRLTVPSRIMRRFDEEEKHYYGVLFLEMQPEDFRYLFDLIYGREFTDEDEELWEGGSAPPRVDIFDE